MSRNTAAAIPAEPLNPDDFMMNVIACTPRRMADVQGIVNVDVRLHLDDQGAVQDIEARCFTVSGHEIPPNDPEILEATRHALSVLRFAPARQHGVAVTSVFEFSFGFMTTALELRRPPPPSMN